MNIGYSLPDVYVLGLKLTRDQIHDSIVNGAFVIDRECLYVCINVLVHLGWVEQMDFVYEFHSDILC